MRLLVRAALSLVVLCCLTERAQGAPKGRYAWVRCNPFGNKSNCVTHMGPWIDLPQPSKAGNPGNVEKTQGTLDPEDLSGDGSGARELSNAVDESDQWPKDEQKLERSISEEGSAEPDLGSGEYDYSNFNFPTRVQLEKSNPPEKELQEENLIL
ncbi:serglycin [Scleropages formosus]|uniref:serglycin n=1 Tax=Scleropages formosus TaxID=113540 RepID=UPI0008789503|nr:serglycin [Scleropages formosus]